MSLNVGSLFEPDWETRRREVVAQILQADPDVICLQELWRQEPGASAERSEREAPDTTGLKRRANKGGRQSAGPPGTDTSQWIVDALGQAGSSYYFVFGGHRFGAMGEQNPSFRFGSAILSRWPIDDSHLWALSTAEDHEDPMPASMPWELVHARTAGLDIFTTHLAPAPTHGRHRRIQVQEIDAHIRETRGDLDAHNVDGARRESMPAILTGDFNAEPDSDEVRFLKGLTVFDGRTAFFQDAWAVAGDDGPGYTSDWRTHPLSEVLNIHRKRIDYVFVGDPFRRAGNAGRVLDCQVIATDPITGIQASDHRGLVTDITWPNRIGQPRTS